MADQARMQSECLTHLLAAQHDVIDTATGSDIVMTRRCDCLPHGHGRSRTAKQQAVRDLAVRAMLATWGSRKQSALMGC